MAPALDCRIHALAFGGYGVGKLPSGKTALVFNSAPGDLVRVGILEEKRSYVIAEIAEILEPAPERIAPPCPIAGVCGGCTWQHLPIAVQRAWKQKLIDAELARQLHGAGSPPTVKLIGGAPFGYRTRTRLHCQGQIFGTLAARSNHALPFAQCPVLSPELEAFAVRLAGELSGLPPAEAEIELYHDAAGKLGAAVYCGAGAESLPWRKMFDGLNVAAWRVNPGAGRRAEGNGELLTERSAEKDLPFPPGVFVQTNREINARLVAEAMRMAGEGGDFGEVYAGAGNFTIHLAARFKSGLAVEGNREAAEMLRRNLAQPGQNVEVLQKPDQAVLNDLIRRPVMDLLLLNPPRSGIKPLYRLFEKNPPRRVVMISCHPMAAVRDLAFLIRAGRYRLAEIVGFDMFPQTDHLELAALLESAGCGG